MPLRTVATLDAPVTPAEVAASVPDIAAALAGTGPAVLFLPPEPVPVREHIHATLHTAEIDDDDLALVVPTSGSTGIPRVAMLSGSALRASAEDSATMLGGSGTWVHALASHYIAGLMVVVRSIVAGTPLTVLDSTGGFRPDRFAEAAAQAQRHSTSPTMTALVPTQLHRIVTSPDALSALRSLDAVLVGGAACPTHLLDRARNEGVNVVTTYGMTETCGGCVYDGIPYPRTDVRIDDGLIELRGPQLFSGYVGLPHATAAVLRDSWFHTGDRGHLDDGVLHVLGRSDDVVITGGVNVSLSSVENALHAVRGVHQACAVAVNDDQWGCQIIAFITADTEAEPEDVRSQVRQALGSAATPRHIVVVPQLPTLTSGKPDRQALRTLAKTHVRRSQ